MRARGLTILAVAAFATPVGAADDEHEWPTTFPSLEQALSAAKQAGRPLVIDLSGEN